MKKIIASVMLACFGASILIAEVPAAVAASSDPFAGVEGVELSAVEEGDVEGGFVPVAVAGVVITADVVAKALVTGGCIAVVATQLKQPQVIQSSGNDKLSGKPGEIKTNGKTETKIGSDGKAEKERHNTDHGNPKAHTNPHDHIIEWKPNGNPSFSKPINYPNGAPKFK